MSTGNVPERRSAPAVNLSRFAGLLGSEEERPTTESRPTPIQVNAPKRRSMLSSAIISNVLDGASIAPSASPASPTISINKVALDGSTTASRIREARTARTANDMLRAVFGRDLVEVRTQNVEACGLLVVAVLRGRPEARRRELYSVSDDGWEMNAPHVEVDVTEAVLSSNYEELRRIAAEHGR